jgi:hypothetical protein
MNSASLADPDKRQVLVNLGNRFVVFGPEGGLPEPLRFDPDASPILPRVADESEVAESRIAKTLQVAGMTRAQSEPAGDIGTDIELVSSVGDHILVEVKVRERDPKQRDFDAGMEHLKLAKSKNQRAEVWFFNIERLKLTVMRLEGSVPQFEQLVPLNVWEKTSEGIFERSRVVDEVEDWVRRIERLYAQVREWIGDKDDLRLEQTRTVTMSEEMMQKFAVTDRELPILDVLRGDQVVTSFVPRGLWLIGAWGRIDIITKERTWILIAPKKDNEFEWRLVSSENRRQTRPFEKALLVELTSTG